MHQYKHLVQREKFCSAACLQMVLFRRGNFVDQEEIAKRLGVTVYETDLQTLTLNFDTVDPKTSIGGVGLSDFSKSDIFKEYNLKAEAKFCNSVECVKTLVKQELEKGNDIIMNGRWEPISGRVTAHYVLIHNLDDKGFHITDPNFLSKKEYIITEQQLKESISQKIDNKERGFLIVSNL